MKRKIGFVLTALGATSGLASIWWWATGTMTEKQGVAAAVTTGVLLLSGGLIFE